MKLIIAIAQSIQSYFSSRATKTEKRALLNNPGSPVIKGEVMKAVGVVVEYNPFHNGHQFHLNQTIEQSGADVIIAVMSGNFLQRGEPALVSKWARTKMALLGGADIIFELPYQFATQNADIFAKGAVNILAAANCHSLCFGSESGDIDSFNMTLDFLDVHEDVFQTKVKEYMREGVSYPTALSQSFKSLSPNDQLLDLSKPNNILGLQYVAAIRSQKLTMEPLTIIRKSANYHDEHFASNSIASATSIRKALFSHDGQINDIQAYLPPTSYEILAKYQKEFGHFHSWENYWPLLKYKLLQSTPAELRKVHEVEEGLEHRLLQAARSAITFEAFMKEIKTKRYTWTRLQRVCLHIMMNIQKETIREMTSFNYLRLLGMTSTGREYLRKEKKNFGLPLISKLSTVKEQLELDIRASRIYALGFHDSEQQNKLIQREFTQPPIQVD